MLRRFQALSLLLMVLNTAPSLAAEPAKTPKTIDFAGDVYPILRRACIECHGPERQEGDLRLDQRAFAFDSGAIVPGDAENSELLRRVKLSKADDEVMPAVGDPLSQKQIAKLQRWIEQGAQWPEDFDAGVHWAYVPPVRPPSPQVRNAEWARSPIDRFVLRRLEEEGLKPALEAAPEKLVRRLFLDLTGLPPTPEEVQAFVADPSEERYERLIDELLDRPQFGEKWARSWLDLARYADSHGFQRDNLRDIWAYRDWVIRALNDDMPFDQFTLEQIAGDLLPNASESQKIATGFHRCTPTNVEAGSLPEETRIEQVIDRVNTTGAVWLGVTLECCQCHDHKYDPFTAKDYYQLLAFFNNTKLEADRADPKKPSSIKFLGPSMPISDADREASRQAAQAELDALKQGLRERRIALRKGLETWAKQLAKQLADAPQAHVLNVVDFQSQGATDTHKKLEDGSILLVGGDPPDVDVYEVKAKASLKRVTAIRLEALRDDALPGKGPGRGDPARRNFVLNEFTVDTEPSGVKGEAVRLEFAKAIADFSQKGWPVNNAIDGKPKTGWAIAPQFDKEHQATFVLKQPIDLTDDDQLRIRLVQQYGAARAIGRLRLSAITGRVDATAAPQAIVKAAMTPAKKWTKQQRAQLISHRAKQDAASSKLAKEIAVVEKKLASIKADTTLVMIEMAKPRMASIFERGDYRKPGEQVEPAPPAILHDMPAGSRDRIALAKWLVARDNPLVARVTVNRWWAEIFGRGIVTTVEDFGVKGEPPSHPLLLDWLAMEFMDNGWSMKRTLKTILMSSTYRQSSKMTPDLLERDDKNRLLARGPRFRMDAEMIRDNALAISGLLDLKQFGPPIRPYQPAGIWSKVGGTAYQYKVSPGSEQYRRGIYVVLKRGSPYPSFINFDATARLACTVQRSRTNTPLQALTLLNDQVYVSAATALAERLEKECKDKSIDETIDYAFQLCTARRPTRREHDAVKKLYEEQLAAQESPKSAEAQSKVWASVATVLLNLHETITKD